MLNANLEEIGLSILTALLFAFLGGLILNLMPCVFPVIALKVLSFAKLARSDNASIRSHALVFTSGVLISFLAIAGIIIALKAGGSMIGCGACVAICKNSSAMLFVGAKVTQYTKLPQGKVERTNRVKNMVAQMDKEGFGNCTNTGVHAQQYAVGSANPQHQRRDLLAVTDGAAAGQVRTGVGQGPV